MLPPALKRWGLPTWQGLRSHSADLLAFFAFVPRFEALVTLRRQELCNHRAHLLATSDVDARSGALGPPRQQGSRGHSAHKWATAKVGGSVRRGGGG